jgi:hypothetical protein
MSPRRNYPKNKRPKSDERDISTSNQTIEEHHEGMYIVRKLTGSSSTKPYRCPGCDQMIPMMMKIAVVTGITHVGQRKINVVLIPNAHATRRDISRNVLLTIASKLQRVFLH